MNNKSVLLDQSLVAQCAAFAKSYTGSNYFEELALFLARKVGVSYVLIGHLEPENSNKVVTVALIAGNQAVPNMTYGLYGTPCENVVGRNCCYFPTGVQRMFPEDKELQDLNVESYIGWPLKAADGTPLGLIVLMHEQRMTQGALIESALEAVAGETERRLQNYLSVARSMDPVQ